MTVGEILLIKLGTRLAKLLLKTYLKAPGEAMGAELVDIAKGKIEGYLDRQEAKRQFERIGERIAAQLLPFFEAETRPGEVNAEAVIDQLARALEGNISAEFFLARDLDPAKLIAELRRVHPLPRGQFSEAEVQLYERALAEAVRYIVEVATKLPRFEVSQVKESLERLSRIEDVVGETAKGVRRIEEWVALQENDSESRQYEVNYRLAVSRNLDYLELFGADLSPESRRQGLSVAYVSLSLETPLGLGDEQTTSSPVETVLSSLADESGRLLIRGEAGCGKSTLFRWVAIQAAQGLFPYRGEDDAHHGTHLAGLIEGNLTMGADAFWSKVVGKLRNHYRFSELNLDWRFRIPFLLRLRDCKGGKLPSPDDFPSMIAREIGSPPTAWVITVLRSGRGLLLFDGIDEIPNLHRETAKREIEAIVGAYPSNLFLVSSRPEAIPMDWLSSLGFREARVNPMSDLDRSRFIDKWHEAVATELTRIGRLTDDLPRLAEELKRQLPENPPVARLATNPLLCAMICALHRDRGQKLPESQSDLCESLCQVLLHRRERESGLDLSEFPEAYRKLKYPQKRVIVQEIAHSMVLNGESTITIERAQEKVADALHLLAGESPVDAEVVCRTLVERSGMLRATKPNSLDFIHNTFKEYLAGDSFANAGDAGLLAEHALDPTWQRVVLFAVATQRQGFADEVIRRLLEPAASEVAPIVGRSRKGAATSAKEVSRARHLLALQCRASALLIAPELETKLDSIALSMFPPRNMEDAEALAASGEMAVPFLSYRRGLRAAEAAACVRALRLVGTPRARALLDDYLGEPREKVVHELCQAVNPLSIMAIQRELMAGGDLSDGVRSQISDLSPLNRLKGILRLDLSGTQVSDIGPLSELRSLQVLDLSRTQVSDLRPLANLKDLQLLGLSRTPVSDLRPLSGLTSLEILDLSGTKVTDLVPLSSLVRLQRLYISTTKVSDIRPLASLSDLEGLILSGTEVSDVAALSGLLGLRWVLLSGTKVADTSPLTALPQLTLLR